MTDELKAKLERIQRYATQYELIVRRGEEKYLIAYTSRRTRHGIIAVVREENRAKLLIEVTGSPTFDLGKKAADGLKIGYWTVNFSGRTQREAYIEGELPPLKDAVKVVA